MFIVCPIYDLVQVTPNFPRISYNSNHCLIISMETLHYCFTSKRTLSFYEAVHCNSYPIFHLIKSYKFVLKNDLLSAINKQLLFEREQLLLLSEKYLFENNPN